MPVTLIQVKKNHYHHLIEAKTKLLSDILKVLHMNQAESDLLVLDFKSQVNCTFH